MGYSVNVPTDWRYLASDGTPINRDSANMNVSGWGGRREWGFVATTGDLVAFIANGAQNLMAVGDSITDLELTETNVNTLGGNSVQQRGNFFIPEYDLYFYFGQDADDDVMLGAFKYTNTGTPTWTYKGERQLVSGASTCFVSDPLWYYVSSTNAIRIVWGVSVAGIETFGVVDYDMDTDAFGTVSTVSPALTTAMAQYRTGSLVSPSRVEGGDPRQIADDPTLSTTSIYWFILEDTTNDFEVYEINGNDAGGLANPSTTPMSGSPLIDWSVAYTNVTLWNAMDVQYDPVNEVYVASFSLTESSLFVHKIFTCSTPNGTWTEIFDFTTDSGRTVSTISAPRYMPTENVIVGGLGYYQYAYLSGGVNQWVWYTVNLSDGTYTESDVTTFTGGASDGINSIGTTINGFIHPRAGDTGDAVVMTIGDMTFSGSSAYDYTYGYHWPDAAFVSGVVPFYGWGIPMGIA